MAKTTDEKIADPIRRLSTNHGGEIIAAVHALRRVLKAIMNGHNVLTEAEMDRLYSAGYELGKADGLEEAKRDVEFYAVSDEDDRDWYAMVRFCFERKARLRGKNLGFIESIARQIRFRTPTDLQRPWLIDIYHRLGGK